jgi:hypothetical protein
MGSTGTARVYVRIEGEKETIFEGPVTTKPHDIKMPSGETFGCDGTNNNARAQLLERIGRCLHSLWYQLGWVSRLKLCLFIITPPDTSRTRKFDPKIEDYVVTSVGDIAETAVGQWTIYLNY